MCMCVYIYPYSCCVLFFEICLIAVSIVLYAFPVLLFILHDQHISFPFCFSVLTRQISLSYWIILLKLM